LRRTKIRKKSKSPLAKAKDKLWKTLKNLIDIRDGPVCISCGAHPLVKQNKQGGHFIPSSSCGGFLRYDLSNVHNQCATCNLFRNGAGAEYTRALEKKYSTEFVDKIIQDKQVTIKLDVEYVEALTSFYEKLLSKNQKQLIELTKKYEGFRID
jgi:hypothetical protein